MNRFVPLFAAAVLFVCSARGHAGSITIREAVEGSIAAATDLEAPVIVTDPNTEFASVSGLIRPATSPSPLVPPGVRYAVLTEGLTGPTSDIIRLTASPIGIDAGGLFQQITVDFFSDDFPGFDAIIPPSVIPQSAQETGNDQDVTALLGIKFPQENVQVIVSSDLNAVPEPASLALLGIGIASMAGYGWRRRKQTVS